MKTRSLRVPTAEEFNTYDGAHCHQLWASVGPHWICPSCQRSKFHIMRWTMRFPRSEKRFEGWMAGLHRHHDHARSWDGVGVARFDGTVICDQCNSADGSAKRRLALPANFSFSPAEIGQFVVATNHGRHRIVLEAAVRIYRSL